MNDKDFHKVIKRYVNGKSTPEEARAVEAFYKRNQDKELPGGLAAGDEAQLREKMREKMWGLIREQASLQPQKEQVPAGQVSSGEPRPFSVAKRPSWPRRLAVAASVALVIGTGLVYFLLNSAQTVDLITKTTARGQKSTITLADGSQVRLNAESTISYPETFEGNTREIILTGEAFFDVTRDESRPFIIRSGEVTTTVLGTSFNISAFPAQDIAITVATGKVQVVHNPQAVEGADQSATAGSALKPEGQGPPAVVLVKGEQARFDISEGTIEKQQVDFTRYTAWKEGILFFDDIALRDAAKILERWYNVTIAFESEDLGQCHIEGKYEDEKLLNILESLKFVKGLSYEFQKDGTILIKGTDCKN